MFEQSTHTMELAQTYASGAEEWHCPTCGRRMIMQWPPKYKKIVLEPGDEQAAHAGGTGGLQMGGVQVAPVDDLVSDVTSQFDDRSPDLGDEDSDDTLDHEALGPWLKWFGDTDMDEAA